MTRFDHVAFDADASEKAQAFKEDIEEIARNAEAVLPQGRPLSLALTKLEEAHMWIGKAIRDEQIARASTP